jgi:hypothetical protein
MTNNYLPIVSKVEKSKSINIIKLKRKHLIPLQNCKKTSFKRINKNENIKALGNAMLYLNVKRLTSKNKI